jgi:hypothetical protein
MDELVLPNHWTLHSPHPPEHQNLLQNQGIRGDMSVHSMCVVSSPSPTLLFNGMAHLYVMQKINSNL